MSPAEILLDQVRAQLDHQPATLDAMRTVAGVVLTGAGIVAGFIAPTLSSKHPGWAIPATVAFVMCVVVGIAALLPRTLKLAEKVEKYATWIETHGTEDDAAHVFTLGLVRNLEANRLENNDVVCRVTMLTAGTCIAFGLEVVLWLVGLALAG